MLRLVRHIARLLVLPALAAPAAAQLAQSTDVRLTALALDGAGGDLASQGTVAQLALGELTGHEMASSHFRASIGFLAGDKPALTAAPIIYGIVPGFGPVAGGTVITLTGTHFDGLGGGGGVQITLGGQPASDVLVKSASLITLVSPPNVSGPCDLVLSGGAATATRAAAFLYTPAVTTTAVVAPGGVIELRNIGPPGDSFVTLVSLTAWSAPTHWGTQLIGPVCYQLFQARHYPAPDGVSSVSLRLPADSGLSGLTFHFQSLSVSHLPPFAGLLTNASTVSIP